MPDYEEDQDGLLREVVGEWAVEKHERLAAYIDISRYVRRKFRDGTAPAPGTSSYSAVLDEAGFEMLPV